MENYIPDNDTIEDIMNITLTEEKKEELDRMRRKQTEEYQRVWRQLSEDGNNPKLDYYELIYTIVDLYAKIDELEARLNKDD